MTPLAQALAEGALGSRLWLYSTYHCNLTCSYCLTESGPQVTRRDLAPDVALDLAAEARELGFTAVGITGGEPFLDPRMPELLAGIARLLPVLVLTNGTLFRRALLDRVSALAGTDVGLQISLDSADPVANDAMRGPENFRRVIEAVPALVRRGIRVRIATTVEDPDDEALARLCALHRSLGVGDEDHVVRPVLRRGRARTGGLGVVARHVDLPPELTVTADGAFWSPFGPTVTGGVLDTDLLLTRTVRPLRRPAEAMLAVLGALPRGADSTLSIR